MAKITPEQLELKETAAMSATLGWLAGYDAALRLIESKLSKVAAIDNEVADITRRILQATLDDLRRARPANGPKGHA